MSQPGADEWGVKDGGMVQWLCLRWCSKEMSHMLQQRPPLVCESVPGLGDTKPGAAALLEFRRARGGGCV